MLTEKEAKKKWCPMARACSSRDEELGVTINRGAHGMSDIDCFCMGSGCMAWRSEVVSLSHTDRDGEHQEVVMGYCGAFGKPAT